MRSPIWRWPRQAAPRLRVAGTFTLAAQSRQIRYVSDTHALHVHGYLGTVNIGRREHALRPGDVTLTPAGVPSWYDISAPGPHLCVHFWPVASTESRRSPLRIPRHVRPGAGRETIEEQLSVVCDLFRRGERNPAAARAASVAFHAALWAIAAEAGERPSVLDSKTTAALETARRTLEADLKSTLSIPVLAKQIGFSQNYLARLFHARYGMTMRQCRLRARMRQAELLLTTTPLTVKSVGLEVGIADAQYFNKQFRACFGVSPTEMRSAHSRRTFD